jgi:hypothetical protein
MNPSERTSGPQGPAGSTGQSGDGIREKAATVGSRVGEEASRQFERGTDKAADQMQDVAERIRSAADELDDGEGGEMSHYVERMADGIAQVADTLRNKSADELMRDLRRLAQRNPSLFIAGSIAVGFGLSRFAKASGQRARKGSADREASDRQAQRYGNEESRTSAGSATFAGGLGGNLDPYGSEQTRSRKDLGAASAASSSSPAGSTPGNSSRPTPPYGSAGGASTSSDATRSGSDRKGGQS